MTMKSFFLILLCFSVIVNLGCFVFCFFSSVAPFVSRTFCCERTHITREQRPFKNLCRDCSEHAQAQSDLKRLQKVCVYTRIDHETILFNYQLLPMLSINVLFVIECANVMHLLKCLNASLRTIFWFCVVNQPFFLLRSWCT